MTGTTRKDLVSAIAAQMHLKQSVVNEVVYRTFEAITETLLREQRIELRGFGVFKIRMRAARQARNPRTTARIVVPARSTVSFKPGVEMKKKIADGILPGADQKAPFKPVAVATRRTVRTNHHGHPAAPPPAL
jgi:DNA-binding protein HU-beta/integration host factor subunit beta